MVAVIRKDVPTYGNWVATLDGYVNANIEPQVSGYLILQDYREGSYVRKGEVLFEIDPRPFQAALDQAKGQLAQTKGQLGQAEAQLGLAIINVNRDTPLAKARAIAQTPRQCPACTGRAAAGFIYLQTNHSAGFQRRLQRLDRISQVPRLPCASGIAGRRGKGCIEPFSDTL